MKIKSKVAVALSGLLLGGAVYAHPAIIFHNHSLVKTAVVVNSNNQATLSPGEVHRFESNISRNEYYNITANGYKISHVQGDSNVYFCYSPVTGDYFLEKGDPC